MSLHPSKHLALALMRDFDEAHHSWLQSGTAQVTAAVWGNELVDGKNLSLPESIPFK